MHQWIAIAAASMAPGADAPLLPSGKWNVDYQVDTCVLMRNFGPAATPTVLGFEPNMVDEGGRLSLIFASGDNRTQRGTGQVSLQPSGVSLRLNYVSAPIKDQQRAISLQVDALELATIGDAKTITLDAGEEAPVILQTDGMVAALDAIHQCKNDQFKRWGVDPSGRLTIGLDVVSKLVDAHRDYPRSAIDAHAQGRVVTLLTVGNDGKILDCRILTSAGNKALDDTTCALSRHVHFEPAERDPKLAPRWALSVITWVLPR